MDAKTKREVRIFPGLRQQRGAQLVEFALIAPLLFLLIFGIIEFSIILYDQAVITNASREGARFAAMYYINPAATNDGTGTAKDCSDVQTFVQNYVYSRVISLTSTPGALEGCCGGTLTDGHTVEPCTPGADWPAAGTTTGLDTSAGSAGYVQGVTVSYSYNFLVFGKLMQFFGVWNTPTWNLTATSVMRDEDQNPGS